MYARKKSSTLHKWPFLEQPMEAAVFLHAIKKKQVQQSKSSEEVWVVFTEVQYKLGANFLIKLHKLWQRQTCPQSIVTPNIILSVWQVVLLVSCGVVIFFSRFLPCVILDRFSLPPSPHHGYTDKPINIYSKYIFLFL